MFNVVNAQIGEPRKVLSLGANAGIAMNSVDFDPTIKQKMHVGPSVGLSIKYTSEKYFTTLCALYAELNYTQLGWKEDIRSLEGQRLDDTYSRSVSYLQLPIFARLAWGKEQRGLQFFFQAGPQIGLCIGDSDKRSAVWTTDEQGIPSRPNHVVAQYDLGIERKFDYGIAGGLGLEYNSPIGHFVLEGRYYYGLGDMFGNSKKDPFARSANGTIHIKLAYLMDLTRIKE
ncbi:MAG: PorT family protein [Bacteroidaceae bacterium]|nr:PorT family protein [Bacteroidaceae bacterium]